MTKPQWGTKHLCQNCSARFYDMKKVPPVCPKCGTIAETESKSKSRRAAPVVEEAPKPEKRAVTKAATDDDDDDDDINLDDDDLDVDLDDDEDEDDDSLIEDASDLTGDDDMAEVLVHVEDGDGDKT